FVMTEGHVIGRPSLPARERGSKPPVPRCGTSARIVAPRAGARIETLWRITRASACRSLPARERGSKLVLLDAAQPEERSLPARERGSKRGTDWPFRHALEVAPRAGARIETDLLREDYTGDWSLPARERGSKLIS